MAHTKPEQATGTAVQRVCVLGSTGSIGENTLAVIDAHPERTERYRQQVAEWRERYEDA